MRFKSTIFVFFLLLVLLTINNTNVLAADSPEVYFLTDKDFVAPGEQFTVDIMVRNVNDLYGASIDLRYDTILEVVEANGKPVDDSTGIFSGEQGIFNELNGYNAQDPSLINYAVCLTGQVPGLNITDGSLGKITFRVKQDVSVPNRVYFKVSHLTSDLVDANVNVIVKLANSLDFDQNNPDYDKIAYTGIDKFVDVNSALTPELIINPFNNIASTDSIQISGQVINPVSGAEEIEIIVNGISKGTTSLDAQGNLTANVPLDSGVNFVTLRYAYDNGINWSEYNTIIYWNTFMLSSIPTYDEQQQKYDGNILLDFASREINSTEQAINGKLYKIDFENKQVVDQNINLNFTLTTNGNRYEAFFNGPFNVGEQYFIELSDSQGPVGNAYINIHPDFNITTEEWYRGTVGTDSLTLSGYLAFHENGYSNFSIMVEDDQGTIIDQRQISNIDEKGNFDVPINLSIGKNLIIIELTELDGGWTRSERYIFYENLKVHYMPAYDFRSSGDLELDFDSAEMTSPTLRGELYKFQENGGEQKVADLVFSLNNDWHSYLAKTSGVTFAEGELYGVKIFDSQDNLISFSLFGIHPKFVITSGNFAGTVYSDTETILGYLAFVENGYESFTIELNGTEQNISVNPNDNTFSIPINLTEGDNTISIRLTDNYGGTTSGGSLITYDPPTSGFEPPEIVALEQQSYEAWNDGVLTEAELNAAGSEDIPLKVLLPGSIGTGSFVNNQKEGYWIAITIKDSMGNIDFQTWDPIDQIDVDQGYINKDISVGYLLGRKAGENYSLSAGIFLDGDYQGGFEQNPVTFSYSAGTAPVTPTVNSIVVGQDDITITFSEQIIAADSNTITFASGNYSFDIYNMDIQNPYRLGHYGLLQQNTNSIKLAILGDFDKSADYVFKLYTGDFITPTVIAESVSFTFETLAGNAVTEFNLIDPQEEQEIWVAVEDKTGEGSLIVGLTKDDFTLFDPIGNKVDFNFVVGSDIDELLPDYEYQLTPQVGSFEGNYWLRFAKEGYQPISQLVQIDSGTPTGNIVDISFTPDTYEVGVEHNIALTVVTTGIADGTGVNVSLVGPSVYDVVVNPVTGTINNNTATLQINVPDTITAGNYYFQVEVKDQTDYKMVIFTDQVVTEPTATTAGTLTNTVANDATQGQTINFLLIYTLGEDFYNGEVVFTLPLDYAAAPLFDGEVRLPFHDRVKIANAEATDLLESQVEIKQSEGLCVVTIGNINALAGQTVVLEMNGEYLHADGTFTVSAKGDADGPSGAKTPSAGTGNEVTSFTIIPATDATLNRINLSQGTLDPAFDPNIFTYNVVLPNGTTEIPSVSADPIDFNDEIVITQADSIPGTATIVVTSADGQKINTYTVNFSTPISPKITAANSKGVNGSTVSVPITIENGSEITGVQFDLYYDPFIVQAVALTEVELANLTGDISINNTEGKITFLYYSENATPIANNCTLGNMEFNIVGEAGQRTTLDINNVQIGNSGGALQFIDVDGSIEVIAVRYGDVNNDGNINVFDILEIVDHILERQVLTGSGFIAADVTGDNSLNVFDILEIVDYILNGESFTVES